MKRALSALMIVTAGGGVASADPSAAKPRALATGAPACGNVMSKYAPPDPVCVVLRDMRALGELARKYREELQKLDVKTRSPS